jgi:3-phosphoshikimate 1-carboxyvinyltransferase
MATQYVSRARALQGKPIIPGDKSISHRGLILGSLAHGTTEIIDALDAGDTRSTWNCLSSLGVMIHKKDHRTWVVRGMGDRPFQEPAAFLDCGNSGTSLRLLMGVLAGARSERALISRLQGDASLNRRPMKRVAEPLRQMGAQIALTSENFAPVTIQSTRLHGVDYELKIASAQLKSALLLAGISAQGTLSLRGEIQSRDHTERMLAHFGASIRATPQEISLECGQKLRSAQVQVPGDPSTASFWMAAASILPGSRIEMENISLNPTRLGFLNALKRMGAKLTTELHEEKPEPRGRIVAESGALQGVKIGGNEIPGLIDELPLLAIVATQADGLTEVTGASELRVKESDRLEAIAQGLREMGAEIELLTDGFRIQGPQKLKAACIQSFHDHRIAMAFSIAGLVANDSTGATVIENAECVAISYPSFYETLASLRDSL